MQNRLPRREFLAGSAAALCAAGAARVFAAEAASARAVFELRLYYMNGDAMTQRAHAYLKDALLPAAARAGSGPVGVFEEVKPSEKPAIYVLINHPSADAALAFAGKLAADAEHAKAGEAFLKAAPKDPAYVNLESRLMLAADFMPKLETPEKLPTRVFELRRYRSPSEPAFRKKLEMFSDVGGELKVFRRTGLAPVFFGEMLFGPDMPNITYMLTYPTPEARGKGWGAFSQDPDWKKLRVTPGYTDPEIIAGITSTMLKPTAYSQI